MIVFDVSITRDELEAQLVAGQLIINGVIEHSLLGEIPIEVVLTVTDHEPITSGDEEFCEECLTPGGHHRLGCKNG